MWAEVESEDVQRKVEGGREGTQGRSVKPYRSRRQRNYNMGQITMLSLI
jgi:hypothetical protein